MKNLIGTPKWICWYLQISIFLHAYVLMHPYHVSCFDLYICIYAYIYTYIYIYTHIYIYTYTYNIYIYRYAYVIIYILIYVYMMRSIQHILQSTTALEHCSVITCSNMIEAAPREYAQTNMAMENPKCTFIYHFSQYMRGFPVFPLPFLTTKAFLHRLSKIPCKKEPNCWLA